MNYELAKKLKEAGFPQEYKNTTRKTYGKLVYIFGLKGLKIRPRPTVKQFNQMEFVGLDVVCLPSLSELIEACGNVILFFSDGDTTRAKGWYCAHGELGVDERFVPEDSGRTTTNGSTPEEAVAKLWLTLHKP